MENVRSIQKGTFDLGEIPNMSQTQMTVDQLRAAAKKAKPKKLSKADHAARFAATPSKAAQSETEKQQQRALFERHDAVEVSIRLPLPPSVDHYYESKVIPNCRFPLVYIGDEGKAYIEDVAQAWKRHWNGWPPDPITGRIRFLMRFSFRNRREKQDISNRVKALEDSLTKCGAWLDDEQIDDERLLRGPVCPPTGYVDCWIETIPE